MRQIVVGMSGHIDHGKTSIIKSLTGKRTERYSEEIKRGLTIDIGFAFLNDEITLIDVPGHEKFIKNMLSGSYAIDFAVLVIAADDGVMPQTKEHFEILQLLEVSSGIIVLNKIDLVEQDWIDLLIDDIKEMTKGSFLEGCNIIQTSTTENIGISQLKDTIINHASNVVSKEDKGFFRMAIDRAFIIKGYGTVVTGTVTSGKIRVGELIEVMPNQKEYKVRGLQSHENEVDEVSMGSRAAINISNINIESIYRGHQISSPGYLKPIKNFIASVSLLPTTKRPLKQNQRIRVHIGTNECIARISLVDLKEMPQGENDIVLIKPESNIISIMGDKFILRNFSPLVTIGGGTFIDEVSGKSWKEIKSYIKTIKDFSSEEIKKYIIKSKGFNPIEYNQVKIKFGLGDVQINQFINSIKDMFLIEYKFQKWIVVKDQINYCKNQLLQILKSNKDVYDIGFSKSIIIQRTNNGNESFLDFLLGELKKSNKVYKDNEKWIIKGESVVLSESDKSLKDSLLDILNKELFVTSNLEDLSIRTNFDQDKVKKILNILEQSNEIIRLNQTLIFTIKNIDDLKSNMDNFFLSNDILLMKDFKAMANTTRKYAVPLLEYFDKIKYTFRVSEGRKLMI